MKLLCALVFFGVSSSIFAMSYIADDEFKESEVSKDKPKRQKYFKNSSEVVLTNTTGNSNVQTYHAKTENTYKFQNHKTVFGGHYTYGEANSLLNAQNWDANLNYFLRLNDKVSLVAAEIIEGNRFQEVKTRYNTDLGSKYHFINTNKKKLSLLTAYRYTNEHRYGEEDTLIIQNKGRFLGEWSRKPMKNLEWKLSADYIPNFTDVRDWLFTGEGSVKNTINSLFSIKVSYKYMVDNLPASPELKKYDSIFTTSLVMDFD